MISSNMKRRRFFKTIAALPAAPALIAQAAPPQAPAGRGASNIPTFQETSHELVADAEPKFFTPPQFAALRRLSALFMPPLDGNPGALECQAPEFLDFLIGASPPDRQKLYRDGLDTLNANAKKKFKKAFADLNDARPTPSSGRCLRRSLGPMTCRRIRPNTSSPKRAATSAPPRRIRASGQPAASSRDAEALAAAELTCCRSIPFTGASNMLQKHMTFSSLAPATPAAWRPRS